MLKVALLSAEPRMSHQIQVWMRELGDLKVEQYNTLEEFKSHIENPMAAIEEAAKAAADSGEGVGYEQLGAGLAKAPYRLLVVDFEMLPAKPFKYISEVCTQLKIKNLYDSVVGTRILVMAFEGGTHRPENMRTDAIDDLILKPLDRSLFLQKVEILLADTPKVRPSFLYRQSTKMRIEVGKDGVMDEISEFGVAIRNPTPLVEGLYAALHSELFGQGEDGRVLGRVYHCAKHPTIEGYYLVRFSFFGLKLRQMLNVKNYVRSHQVPLRTKSPRNAGSAAHKAHPPLPRDLRRVAVIDMNPLTFNELKSALETNFKDVTVQSYPSYSRFLAALAKFLPPPGSDDAANEAAPSSSPEADTAASADEPSADQEQASDEPAWPRGGALKVILGGEHHEVHRFEPALEPTDLVMGRAVSEWTEKPDSWIKAVVKDDAEEFQEFLSYVATGGQGHGVYRMRNAKLKTVYLEAKGTIEKAGDVDSMVLLRIELHEITKGKWLEIAEGEHTRAGLDDLRFDAIFVDGSVLRGEPVPWLQGLEDLLTRTGIIYPGIAFPKVFVMADEASKLRAEAYRIKGITDFFFKPIERKFIVQKAAALIPRLEYSHPPDASPYIPCELPVRLAKDVMMNEVSEYGLSVLHRTPFREKVFMRFFSNLFGFGEGIIGRCVLCEFDKDRKAYQCHFTFFGSTDETLSKIRAWIREDYVHKKEGTAG